MRRPPVRVLCSVAVVVVVVIIGVSTTWQVVRERAEHRAFPPPGRLVSTPSGTMHLDCRGAGAPTVVLLSGSGDHSLTWGPVRAAMSPSARVCAYDRPGTGWSPSRMGRARASMVVSDLAAVLHASGELPPYVLVGHSMGGLYAEAFAAQHRDLVAGLVLVESSEPHMYHDAGRFARIGDLAFGVWDVLLTSTGVNRMRAPSAPDVRYLPADRAAAAAFDLSTTASVRGFEEMWVFPQSARDVEASGALAAGLPVGVVSSALTAHPSRGELSWRAAQKRLARLTDVSAHWIAQGHGHRLQLDEPALVVTAIEWVIERSVSASPTSR